MTVYNVEVKLENRVNVNLVTVLGVVGVGNLSMNTPCSGPGKINPTAACKVKSL